MANAPPPWESFVTEEGSRKIYMEKDTRIPNAAIFTVMREDHTLANMLRSKLLSNPKVLFAGYKIAHPLEPEFTLRLQTTSDTSPLEVLQDEINKLISELRDAETEFEVLFLFCIFYSAELPYTIY